MIAWSPIETRPESLGLYWICNDEIGQITLGYPARFMPKGVWRAVGTGSIIPWTPTHWAPLERPGPIPVRK